MGFQEQRSPGTHPSPVQNGMNSGTSFLSPALFPASLLKQDVAGETHPPFPVFPLNDSAEEHLAAANEWAIPACRAGDADLLQWLGVAGKCTMVPVTRWHGVTWAAVRMGTHWQSCPTQQPGSWEEEKHLPRLSFDFVPS